MRNIINYVYAAAVCAVFYLFGIAFLAIVHMVLFVLLGALCVFAVAGCAYLVHDWLARR